MSKTLVYSFILVASILLTSFSLVSVYGGSGSTSACTGDCTPPTMGLDSNSQLLITNGFGINENYFDVDYYSQNLPTQILEVGKRNTITFKLYENSGPQYFQHLELHIAVINKVINGIVIEDSLANIAWNVDFEGTETTLTKDPTNILQNVEVKKEIKDVLTIITIEFEMTQPMETSTIMVYQWDAKKNSWKNYFVDAISVVPSQVSPDSDSDGDGAPDLVEEQQIPDWIQNNAKWWSEWQIDDDTFVQGIEWLITEGVMSVSDIDSYETSETSGDIPTWVRNNAGWWADGLLSDDDFVNGIKYLVEKGIIKVYL